MRIYIGALFACLAIAFGAPACAVPDSPSDQSETVQSDLNTDEATTNFACNGFEPGLPVPSTKELAFSKCERTCLAGPLRPTPADCKRTCCIQFTGCGQCFIQ